MPDFRHEVPSRTTAALVLLAAVLGLTVAACTSIGESTEASARSPLPPSIPAASSPSGTTTSSAGAGTESPALSAAPRVFPFSVSAISGFYEGEGLVCAAPVASTTAAGWSITTCEGPDPTGRTVVIGLITDPDGTLGAGFATVTARPDEDLLEPTDAIDTLSGFLGAMLGDEPATELLPWLAGHLGEEYAETTADEVTVATYIESPDDSTRIYLEVDGPAYLAAPPPG